MMKLPLFVGLSAVLLLQSVGCSGEPTGSDVEINPPAGETEETTAPPSTTPPKEDLSAEKPWEVISDQGESLLPNVFYADPSENEQVMPTAIDGHDQIDRLVYPTLGNPNLYVKGDAADKMVVVLRIEEAALDHLAADIKPGGPKGLETMSLRTSAGNDLSFYLVARAGRTAAAESTTAVKTADGKNVIEIEPTALLVNPLVADMPARLKTRRTVRAIFDQAAMAKVAAGLYDIRFEVKRNGLIANLPGERFNSVYEYQYNAVRVFEKAPAADEYKVLNVTDTQVSVGAYYDGKTQAKLTEFVNYINQTSDTAVRQSAFITFNGDLHNGGAPAGVRQRFVATNYNNEAKVILAALKQLSIPIFLTTGNHDGYVSTGVAPRAAELLDTAVGGSMHEIFDDFGNHAWIGMTWEKFDAYRKSVANILGGFHRDVFTGAFTRRVGKTFTDSWLPVEESRRNIMLYDGFYQWQRSYGPLNASWKFGKNVYVNTNSFDLRQHRRSGWGMYTVNYGGGLSDVQMEWFKREIDRAAEKGDDVIILAHHDPRGGHHGKDYPYMFEQVDYKGMSQSAINYVIPKVMNPSFCKLPTWALSEATELNCMHDGLQEWMRPDPEFDCENADKGADGRCRAELFDLKLGAQAKHLVYSGLQMIDKLTTSPNVRTLIMGHTHANQFELFGNGDALVPPTVTLDADQQKALASTEIQNPLRGTSWFDKLAGVNEDDYDPAALQQQGINVANGHFAQELTTLAGTFNRTVKGPPNRELMLLRLTSNSDLTHQTYMGKTMLGFSVFEITKKTDERAYAAPQINKVIYFLNSGDDQFTLIRGVDLPRTGRFAVKETANPVAKLFVN